MVVIFPKNLVTLIRSFFFLSYFFNKYVLLLYFNPDMSIYFIAQKLSNIISYPSSYLALSVNTLVKCVESIDMVCLFLFVCTLGSSFYFVLMPRFSGQKDCAQENWNESMWLCLPWGVFFFIKINFDLAFFYCAKCVQKLDGVHLITATSIF